MQETVREGYFKEHYKPLEGMTTANGQVVKKQSDGSLWVAGVPVGSLKCVRRELRTLTRSEAKQLGLA